MKLKHKELAVITVYLSFGIKDQNAREDKGGRTASDGICFDKVEVTQLSQRKGREGGGSRKSWLQRQYV